MSHPGVTETPCTRCGSLLVIGTSADPYCPNCERAYHALEERYRVTGKGATVEEVVKAMTEDAVLAVSGVSATGGALLKLVDDR
jgi:hypothetical protein